MKVKSREIRKGVMVYELRILGQTSVGLETQLQASTRSIKGTKKRVQLLGISQIGLYLKFKCLSLFPLFFYSFVNKMAAILLPKRNVWPEIDVSLRKKVQSTSQGSAWNEKNPKIEIEFNLGCAREKIKCNKSWKIIQLTLCAFFLLQVQDKWWAVNSSHFPTLSLALKEDMAAMELLRKKPGSEGVDQFCSPC